MPLPRSLVTGVAIRVLVVASGVACAAVLLAATAFAAGPRWTAGPPYFTVTDNRPIVWYTSTPEYFTDPGDLSSFVDHAAADALVASAAATWNIPLSSVVLARGGNLDEHLNSSNVYLDSSGLVLPADAGAAGGALKPIAIVYDADGSVTDTLLGGGASDPSNCRQSAVTESVDSISTLGQIRHALIILNGRCTGSAPEMQLEMQYKLMRAFGRVLGLGWSQLNDNVFTGYPGPTAAEEQNWPIMHPMDLFCGHYAYQCLVQPFALRTDDIASLVWLYPVPANSTALGKSPSYAAASYAYGNISFADGQGMQGVNVKLRRFHDGPGFTDPTDIVSGVSGYAFQRLGGNPVTPKGTGLTDSFGAPPAESQMEGYYLLGWIPVPTQDYWEGMILSTEPVNPLYTGQYAVGPYQVAQVTPSGPPLAGSQYVVNQTNDAHVNMTATNGAGACTSSSDGTEVAPTSLAGTTGLWTGTVCGYGHTAWSTIPIKANRSLTIEVTARDEQGLATTGKLLPVLGIWDAADPAGSPASLGSQAAALNALSLGMTNLRASTATARSIRIGLGDQRGDGRPDFAYNARILYADSVSPTAVPANGGKITITGFGFRQGNAVTVGGVLAQVLSCTANTIVAVVPPSSASTGSSPVDVEVTDLSTGGETTLSAALSYTSAIVPNILTLVSAPANGTPANLPSSTPFSVRMTLPDGTTPNPGVAITLAASNASFSACNSTAACILTTDATGLISSPVTPATPGTVTLTATAGALALSATFTAASVPIDMLEVVSRPTGVVYATIPAASPFTVRIFLPDGSTPAAGTPVTLSAANATLSACPASGTCVLTSDAFGTVSTSVNPSVPGLVTLHASEGNGSISTTFTAQAMPPDILRVISAPASGSFIGQAAGTQFAVKALLGDGITPAAGVTVNLSSVFASLGCGIASCALIADGNGLVSTVVSPSVAGTVTLTGTVGSQSIIVTFTAIPPPADTLRILTQPADGSVLALPAAQPFSVRALLGGTSTPAAGVPVTVSAQGATLGACGASTCLITADTLGTVSTIVTPLTSGIVTLTAAMQGSSISTTFRAAGTAPGHLSVVSVPANGSLAYRVAAAPFSVRVLQSDDVTPGAFARVTLTSAGAYFPASNASSITLTADSTGLVSGTVAPTLVGTVTLGASALGAAVSVSFLSGATPPDVLHVIQIPGDGNLVGHPAGPDFGVQVALGDGSGYAAGAAVTISSPQATFYPCQTTTCTYKANSSGQVYVLVTAIMAGTVTLSATAGGGAVSTTFQAVLPPPDTLQLVSKPADGTLAGYAAAAAFSIRALLPGTATPATRVSVTLSATNGTFPVCGAASCIVKTDGSGFASATITPTIAGTVTLTATVAAATLSTSFMAGALPAILPQIVSVPADGSTVGTPTSQFFTVQAHVATTNMPAAGAQVTLTSTNAILDACGLATCIVTTDSVGRASTPVTPVAAGSVTLRASTTGGSVSASFLAGSLLSTLTLSRPIEYIATGATVQFAAQAAAMQNGQSAVGLPITWTTADSSLTIPQQGHLRDHSAQPPRRSRSAALPRPRRPARGPPCVRPSARWPSSRPRGVCRSSRATGRRQLLRTPCSRSCCGRSTTLDTGSRGFR